MPTTSEGRVVVAVKVEGEEDWERGNEARYRVREHKIENTEVREHSMWDLKVVH